MINKSCDWGQSELITLDEFKTLSDNSKRNILEHQNNYNDNCK